MVDMRLGIDLDGVVADFNAGWTKLHRDEHGSSLTAESVDMWDGLHLLAGFENMDEYWEWFRGGGVRPSGFRHLDLIPDSVDTLVRLQDRGHDIVIVTSKPDWAIHETMAWLSENEVPTREVHFTYVKHNVACDVYLDDGPTVLPGLVEHRPDALVCRFVRAWNSPVSGARDITSWDEFERLVHEHDSAG